MKKGCLIGLLSWAACAGVYWYFLHARFGPPLDIWVPVIAGFLMAVVIGTLQAGLDSAIKASRVAQDSVFSGATGEKPRDGQVVTLSGPVRATGPTLRAPLTDRAAVLYSYDVGHLSGDREGVREVKDFTGFALTPAVIDSRYGSIRLLGFPNLQGFAKERLDPEQTRAKAEEYIAGAPFIEVDVMTVFREVKEVMTDDHGQLRKDWRMATDGQIPDDADFVEQIVSPGEQVTAIGRYSVEKNALIADPSAPLQLLRGGAQAASASLWRSAGRGVIGALIFAAIINGALYGVLRVAHGRRIAIPKSARQIRQQNAEMLDAARGGDVAQMERLLGEGVSIDARDVDLSTPLMHAADGKTAQWLIARGANVNTTNNAGETPLIVQAHLGRAAVVKVLVGAGANLDAVSRKWNNTALQQALDAEKLDVAQILRDAGAHDVTITQKNGHPIGKDSDPVRVVLAYLDAIQRQDAAAMNAASTRGPFKEIDFKLWKESRPVVPRLVSGFADDHAATIVVRGKVGAGTYYATWTYQLVHSDANGWRISNERWETRLDSKER